MRKVHQTVNILSVYPSFDEQQLERTQMKS